MTATPSSDDSGPGSPWDASAAEGRAGSKLDAADLAWLLRRSASGDRDSFAALYDATSGCVFPLAVFLVQDRARAEEITHDAYLEIWRNADRFDTTHGCVLAWLLRIVERRATDGPKPTLRPGRHLQATVARRPGVAHRTSTARMERLVRLRAVAAKTSARAMCVSRPVL